MRSYLGRRTFSGYVAHVFHSGGWCFDVIDADAHQKLPSDAALKTLVRQSLLKFNEAVQQKNFADFYNYVAVSWQEQLTVKRLQRAFQPFIDNGVNISGIQDREPVYYNPPTITTEGLLVVGGYYPTTPYKVIFQAQYTYEFPAWKLFGLTVDLSK